MPPKSENTERKNQPIKLETLDPQQLVSVRQEVYSEIEQINEALESLQKIGATVATSAKSIETLTESKEGQTILLPLTGSIYVPGQIASTEKVMIDVGTGYFIEMTTEQSANYFERRMKALQGNMQSLGQSLREKQLLFDTVNKLYVSKVQASQAAAAKA